jgi:hypothetical protein
MKVKCPRCGTKVKVVDGECPICELPIESTASKPFNKNLYITILILLVIIACVACLFWNSHLEKVAIQKQVDAAKLEEKLKLIDESTKEKIRLLRMKRDADLMLLEIERDAELRALDLKYRQKKAAEGK